MHTLTIALLHEIPESLYERLQTVLEAHSNLSTDELLTQALAQYLAALPV
jgi:hypothetical protein